MGDNEPGSNINNLTLQYLKAKRRVAELACSSDLNNRAETQNIRNEKKITSPTLSEEFVRKQEAGTDDCASCSLSGNNLQQLSSRTQEIEAGVSMLGVEAPFCYSEPNSNNSIILNAIVTHLTNEIRTAGLRKGRESALLALMEDLREEQEKLFHKQLATSEQWKLHAEECILLSAAQIASLDQKMSLCNEEKEHAETKAKLTMDECGQAVLELEKTRFECSTIREEAEYAKNKAREEFIEMKSLLMTDTSKNMDELKLQMQQDKDFIKSTCAREAQIERRKLENKWQKKYEMLETECAHLAADAGRKRQLVETLKIQLEKCTNQKQEERHASDEVLTLLRAELTEDRDLLCIEREKSEHLSKQNQMLIDRLQQSELDRRLELKQIELKVKKAFDFKDSAYLTAIKHLQIAKERETSVERQLQELDMLT